MQALPMTQSTLTWWPCLASGMTMTSPSHHFHQVSAPLAMDWTVMKVASKVSHASLSRLVSKLKPNCLILFHLSVVLLKTLAFVMIRSLLEIPGFPPAQIPASQPLDLLLPVERVTLHLILVENPARGSRSIHWQPFWIWDKYMAQTRNLPWAFETSPVMPACCASTPNSGTTDASCCRSTPCRCKCVPPAEESPTTPTPGRCPVL